MRSFLFDVRYAARVLRQNPGFAAVAILTLALGTGGTTAIFSMIDPVLIRPLPYADPERLVSISMWFPSAKLETLTSADFAQFERESHVFESMAAYPHGLSMTNLLAAGGPYRAAVVKVTPSFFPTLGLAPLMGRVFLPRESRPLAANVAILTHGLWMRGFGGDPCVLGKSIILDEQPYAIVGVMPAGFRFPEEEKVDVLTPLPLNEARLQHGPEMRMWRGIARLKPGVSVTQATADLAVLFERIRAQYKFFYRRDVQLRVVPLQWHQAREVRTSLLVLAAAVGFVLLIACVNVALILMGRASGRAGEIAVRIALGARRMRLARQLLTETALIGLLGGSIGALMAFAGVRSAAHLLPADIPHIDQVAVDMRALGFTALVAISAGVLFGLAPVAVAWRTDLNETLKLGGGASRGRARRSLRSGLLSAEIAFSMALLAGAALLVESLWRLENTRLGFYPERVVVASIPLAGSPKASGAPEKQFLNEALERCARLPNVGAAAFADSLPPADYIGLQTFSREDRPLPEPGHRGDNMLLRGVTADYFRAMGIPLLRGRSFSVSDGGGIVMVNQALARRYFPGEDPLGKRIGGGPPDLHWKTIVGVVGDEKNDGLRSDPQPEAYLPISIEPGLDIAWLVVRTGADPSSIATAIRAELRDLDKTLPVTVRTMPEEIGTLLARPRFQTLMMMIFSALALAMAAIGVYGVASWAVAQRSHEIGVRMVLGAAPGDVLRLILHGAAGPLGIGLIAGTAGALVLGRYFESLLFGVNPNDAVTLAVAAGVLSGAVLVATYIPARRAARSNPAATLRSE